MRPLQNLIPALVLLHLPLCAQSSFIAADGPGDTYKQLEAAGFGIEVPDCAHKVDHFVERQDPVLGRPVFAATMHMQDNDRCMNYDRQRIELRGSGPAQQGAKGKMAHYRWKFRLDAGFKETGNFCHIFQIKAYGNGHGSGAPIVTLTPRSPDRMEIYHRGNVRAAPLSRFKGVWVEAYIKVRHDNGGSMDVTLRRVSDGLVLHTYSGTNLDLWDDGAGYGAPKIGLYRSLDSRGSMRDEDVLLADIAVTLGDVEVSIPSATLASPVPAGRAGLPRLVWSGNGLQFLQGEGVGAGGTGRSGSAFSGPRIFDASGRALGPFPAR